MSNTNSCAGLAQSGSSRNQFPVQTVAATTETILQVATDSGTNSNFFLVAPSGGQVYGSTVGLNVNSNPSVVDRSPFIYGLPSGVSNDQFNSSSWDGHPFKVRVVGTGTAGHNAAQTLLFNLYQGTSATLGSDKIIGTTGAAFAIAQSTTNVSFNFLIEAYLLWDSASQLLTGRYTGWVGGGTTSQFVTTTVIPNLPAVTTPAGLSFLATVTLGNAASSTIQLKEFVVDWV
jgi:hypothetical protein